jgi:Transposase, Mutator family
MAIAALKHRAVTESLEEAGDRLFAFARLPPSQWRSARTTNAIERLHEEFKRRIKTQTVLPSAADYARLPKLTFLWVAGVLAVLILALGPALDGASLQDAAMVPALMAVWAGLVVLIDRWVGLTPVRLQFSPPVVSPRICLA